MMRVLGMQLWLLPLFVALPLLLFGGVYWFPACHIARGRDPLLTMLLAVGLAITVTILGILGALDWMHIVLAVLAAWLMLLLRRAFGAFDRNLERFAQVHMITVLGMLLIAR